MLRRTDNKMNFEFSVLSSCEKETLVSSLCLSLSVHLGGHLLTALYLSICLCEPTFLIVVNLKNLSIMFY